MSNEWDEYAAGWTSDPSVQEYADKAYAELVKVIDPQGLRILDFGCGTGQLTEKLAAQAKHVIALDGSAEMIRYLQQKQLEKVTTIAAYLTPEFIAQKTELQTPFDLIVASSVCSFLPDYDAALGHFKRLLKPGGLFIQWDWLLPNTTTQENDTKPSFGFAMEQVEAALISLGFTEIKINQSFSMTSDKGSEEITMPVLMALAKKV